MDLADASPHVRVGMKRSPLDIRGNSTKQRRVIESPEDDELRICEVQVNEELEQSWPEISATAFDDWQLSEREGNVKEVHSQTISRAYTEFRVAKVERM